jgi:hypothetical protein
MHILNGATQWHAVPESIWSTLIAAISLVRGLYLFLSGRPRTPLRVLCIATFDTLHVLRHSKRLPTLKLKMLAALLDFGAGVNAAFDHKASSRHERRVTLHLLEKAGIGSSVSEYLKRLGNLESSRPRPGGNRWQFQKVSFYREAVVRLSLGMVATAARGNQGLDEAIEATYVDGDLNLLFRIVMQCQIIDDLIDFAEDRSAGLPSFLTACNSLSHSLELTQLAARGYAENCHAARAVDVFPLKAALFLVSMCAQLVVWLRRWRNRAHLELRPMNRAAGPGLLAAEALPRAGVGRPDRYSSENLLIGTLQLAQLELGQGGKGSGKSPSTGINTRFGSDE